MKKSEFKKAKTIPEVIMIAKKLKEAGEDPNEVNNLAYLRKKELMTTVNKVNNLEKLLPRASAKPTHKVSHISFRSHGTVGSSTIVIHEDYSIET